MATFMVGTIFYYLSLWRISILLRHPEDKSEGGSDVIPILFPSTGIGGVVPAPPPFPPPPPPSICFCFSRLPSRAFKEPRNFLHGERGGKAPSFFRQPRSVPHFRVRVGERGEKESSLSTSSSTANPRKYLRRRCCCLPSTQPQRRKERGDPFFSSSPYFPPVLVGRRVKRETQGRTFPFSLFLPPLFSARGEERGLAGKEAASFPPPPMPAFSIPTFANSVRSLLLPRCDVAPSSLPCLCLVYVQYIPAAPFSVPQCKKYSHTPPFFPLP